MKNRFKFKKHKKRKFYLGPRFFETIKEISLRLIVSWVGFTIAVLLLVIVFKPLVEQWIVGIFTRVGQLESTFASRTPVQGSFTELFSGVGWKNLQESTVYQDFKTLTISFPPAYEWEEVTDVNLRETIRETARRNTESLGGTITIGSRTFTTEVEKIGEQYEGFLYEVVGGELQIIRVHTLLPTEDPRTSASTLFSSQYSGKIILGSDGSSKLFLLYSAYEGEAFEIELRGAWSAGRQGSTQNNAEITNDYSNVFNARVTEEGKIEPKIFYKDGAWWISSTSSSPPKFLRIRSGVATDFTPLLLRNVSQFDLVPAPRENELYGILKTESGSRFFGFRDLGFENQNKLVWESLRLNVLGGEVVRGRFTRIENSRSAWSAGRQGSTQNDAETIRYFLSNNGGEDWQEAELNKFVRFKKSGGDFRWRAELFPSKNQYVSSWISAVGVEYYIIRE